MAPPVPQELTQPSVGKRLDIPGLRCHSRNRLESNALVSCWTRLLKTRRSGFNHDQGCKPGLCGVDAACVPKGDGRYTCVCPHDNSPPTTDLKCPNRRTVALTPSPFHNIMITSGANTTAGNSSGTTTQQFLDERGNPQEGVSLVWSGFLGAGELGFEFRRDAYCSNELTDRKFNSRSLSKHHSLGYNVAKYQQLPLINGIQTSQCENLFEAEMSTRHESLPSNNSLMLAMFGVLAVLAVLFLTVCLWKRKAMKECISRPGKSRKPSSSPNLVSLSKGLLVPERYQHNPQYSICTSPDSLPVPVLPREHLTFMQEIGEGCFGKVYKGELKKEDGADAKIVAVKVLKDSASREAEDDFMREVDIMSTFRHTNILSLIGVVLRDSSHSPWMVFEFMSHGDLAEVLRRNSRQFWKPVTGLLPLNKDSLLSVALQISAGMCYLASQRFVHRDLACRNCLVGSGLTVKIADFGMSRDVYTCDYYKGIMLIPPDDCPTLICELMRSCWKTEPRDRIRFPEIYNKLCKARDESPVTEPSDTIPARSNSQGSAFVPSSTPLPRPPEVIPVGQFRTVELLDTENYLLPQVPPASRTEYLQPLPD
uniref:Protein kinase domain-containing protein n=1 Tax=Timema monikensis TaxID=170555 RepID=A0A7R9HLV3_9NEOP|nr:unnamed protein product [Timema monikensis]